MLMTADTGPQTHPPCA